MRLRPLRATLIAWAIALIIGFFVAGHYAWNAMIGLDPSSFPGGAVLQAIGKAVLPDAGATLAGAVLVIALLLFLAIATFFAIRASRRSAVSEADPSRRTFLTGSLAGVAAAVGSIVVGGGAMMARSLAGVGNGGRGWSPVLDEIFGGDVVRTHPEWKQVWKGSRVQSYGRLGRTGWKVSDTALGTGRLRGEIGEKITRLAIERGINYIDTAPDYSGASSEKAVGRAIKSVPRERIFIATKFCTPVGHLGPGSSVEDYKEAVYGSLGRLDTGYVDLIHVHSCDEVDRLMDPNMHEAFAQLKTEGKVRFLGFSSHTPNLLDVATRAIESEKFDVMMIAYHHGIWPGLQQLIKRARHEQDMGVVAMKTLKGAKHHGLEGYREHANSYAQAALKWAHSDGDVSCVVISFFDLQHVDEYLYASGKRVTHEDLTILDKYDREIAGSYCRPYCGACLDSCPEELAINDVLRYRMYFEDYRSEQEGMLQYAKLRKNASVCVGCSAPCAGACPFGIDIQRRTTGAHELLADRGQG